MPASWKPEVYVEGGWSSNALRFASEGEAASYAADLFRRWTLSEHHRAAESNEPVNAAWHDGVLVQGMAGLTKQGEGTP